MAHVRALIALAAMSFVLAPTGSSAAQGPAAVGWFQLPQRGLPAAGVTAGPVPLVTAPLGPAGLIADEGEDFEIVKLKYADVSEIVGLLTGNQTIKSNDDFTPQEPNFGSSSSGSAAYFGSGGGGLPATPILSAPNGILISNDSLGQAVDGTIGIDRRLNAIVLRGSPSRVATIKHEIEMLDVPVTSVVLETQFVELSETGARNLGLDFNNGNGQLGSVNVAYARGFPGTSDTPKFGGVTASFQVALYAQIAKGEGRIVSKPRISAQSGATAKIVTGDALPILTSIALSGVNAVQQQVEYVNVGVTLQIAPRVSDDGFVTAHIFAVVSSVTGFSQGYPTISQREASTSATVHDGETFIIGGLTEESRISNKSKLPILGDIPLVGSLFKVEHTNDTKRDLYIVVTPHIVVRQPTHTPASSAAPR